jgi:hypothetical protein
MSGQLQRETAVKQKLNPIRLELKDKNKSTFHHRYIFEEEK